MTTKQKGQIKVLIQKTQELQNEINSLIEEVEKELTEESENACAYLFEAEGSADNVLHCLKLSVNKV